MKYFCLVFILYLSSCSNKTFQKFDYNVTKNPWIDAFKDQVFFSAIKESYKADSVFKLIQKRDSLNPYDGLSLEAIKKAKFLGEQLIQNMPPPVMCEACENDMNYYLANSLHYYISKELDSIAKSEFKKQKQESKKMGF
jgi:hypothetical protein